ncbi:hypothetical protein GCM10009815_13220 [Nocardioides marmoribigeumensis]
MQELQRLRRSAGEPSYAELARSVTELRLARGLDEHSARVARTTVYDAFRVGRSRVNLDLVRDLATVMRAPEGAVEGWLEAGAVEEERSAPPPTEAPEAADPEEAPATLVDVPGPSRGVAVALVVAAVVANVLGRFLVDGLHLPIYLDMVGTAFVAVGFGPWTGAGVGVASNALGVLSSGSASLPFGVVNAAGALVWGYGVRRGMGRTLPRFLSLNLLVAVTCTLLTLPILGVLYSGSTGHGEDTLVANLEAAGQGFAISLAAGNLLASLADKTISGFLALVALSCFPWARRRGLDLLAPPG